MLCVLHVGPRGIISQHPACHRLEQGGRAGEGIQGWKVITCWSHKSKREGGFFPSGRREYVPVDTAGRVGSVARLTKFHILELGKENHLTKSTIVALFHELHENSLSSPLLFKTDHSSSDNDVTGIFYRCTNLTFFCVILVCPQFRSRLGDLLRFLII